MVEIHDDGIGGQYAADYRYAGLRSDLLRGSLGFASMTSTDTRSGIALIKVDTPSQFIPLGNSTDLQVASPVITIGYPEDLAIAPSFGLIGGFDRKLRGRFFPTTRIRVNLPVQQGNGGAPLLNMR